MKISAMECRHYRIPLPVVLSDSTHGDMSHVGLLTVELTDSSGLTGIGYAYTGNDIGGSALFSLANETYRDCVLCADPFGVEALWDRMWWHTHFVGRGGLTVFAMAAIDVALWDLQSKRAQQPLFRYLGGTDPNVPIYAGGIDLQFTLAALEEQTKGFLAAGFHAIKMKAGRDRLSEDVERVAMMRELLGADFPLLVDANMRWSVAQAVRAARALQRYDLFWLEEPIIPDDVAGHARVAQEGGIPIATGENLHSIYEFQNMIAHGSISFPEPDLVTVGGITPWLKVAHLAEGANLPVTSHGVHDLHVHLLAAVPNKSYLEVHGFGLERYLHDVMVIRDGVAIAPERHGHGVAFNWDALEEHRRA
ncbi:MAG: mandelate racemase/muconate lactonizing enzyme family protein [Gammaproteobacteria bacterium]|nr:mandelate racemase/muconate lactonizing enzyme family protein [Gammaproteobacteria bacterium]